MLNPTPSDPLDSFLLGDSTFDNSTLDNTSPAFVPTDAPIVHVPPAVEVPVVEEPAPSLPRPQRVARPEKTQVWGTDFARLDMYGTIELADQVIACRKPEYFITANLNYLMLTAQHPELAEINAASLAVIADGNPIVRRSAYSADPLPCRVAGSDMIVELSALAADRGYRLFFLGGAPGVAEAASQALLKKFPSLQVAGCYSPPFRKLSDAEEEAMIRKISDAKTDILFVAFGQPKGEVWIHRHLNALQVPLSIQLGASFDFLAGTAKRAPKLWQRIGCEWLYRACSDPKRLAPRYLSNLSFLFKLLAKDAASFFDRRRGE